jgi:hypothetical protein
MPPPVAGTLRQALDAAGLGQTRLIPLPIGDTWEVVRITAARGRQTVTRLRAAGVRPGPVLHNRARGALEFVVEAGASAGWPALPDSWCYKTVTRGMLLCPPARVAESNGAAPRRGRVWLVPPRTGLPPTDGALLCAALASVIASGRLSRAAVR